MMRIAWLLALVLIACKGDTPTPVVADTDTDPMGHTGEHTGGFDTAQLDTGAPPPPADALIQVIDPRGCNAAGTHFEFTIENRGWSALAVLTIWDTTFDPTYDEEHVMSYVTSGYDPATGYWDQWAISLAHETSPAAQTPGVNTVFYCDNEQYLTFAIEVYDQTNTFVNDCAVFGDDPAALIDGTWPNGAANYNGTVIGTRFSNCLNWNP